MIQSLVQQLQGVLSTKDSVETAKVCRAIVEEGVRTICRKLGHSITAESAPDEGTTIRIGLSQRQVRE